MREQFLRTSPSWTHLLFAPGRDAKCRPSAFGYGTVPSDSCDHWGMRFSWIGVFPVLLVAAWEHLLPLALHSEDSAAMTDGIFTLSVQKCTLKWGAWKIKNSFTSLSCCECETLCVWEGLTIPYNFLKVTFINAMFKPLGFPMVLYGKISLWVMSLGLRYHGLFLFINHSSDETFWPCCMLRCSSRTLCSHRWMNWNRYATRETARKQTKPLL